MKKWLSLSLLVLLSTFFINAESSSVQHFECLGDFDEFLYLGDKPYPSPAPAPLPPWKLVTLSKSIPYPGYAEVAIGRVYNGKTEIWMNVAPDEYSIEPTEIVIYYPNTREKVSISTETNLEGVRVDRLFVDHSGTVWGRNRWFTPLIADPPYGEVPVFSTYDERTMGFIAVENVPMVIVDDEEWQVLETDLPQIDTEEGQSVFWIFIQEDGLYRFDSRTFQATRVLDLPEVTVLPLHSGLDGEIYFRTFEYDSRVYKFSYPEGALEEVEIPETGWYGRTSILVDRKLNLWLSGFGWRDPSGEWHSLHPRATEILRFPENFSPYELPSPKIIYESSNGWLWFAKYEEFDNGTAWFNPETGEGCWFTTRSQEVVEDTEGRMWIATDGKLYSLDLYP